MSEFNIGGETYHAKTKKASWYLNQAMELANRQEGEINPQIEHLIALAMINNDRAVASGREITKRPSIGAVIEHSKVPGWRTYRVGEQLFGFDPDLPDASDAEQVMLQVYDFLHREEVEHARETLSHALIRGMITPMADDLTEDED